MSKDSNTCPHCRQRNTIEDIACSYCRQAIVLPADCAITIRRVGPVRDGLTEILSRVLSDAFEVPCVIQPAFMDERPSLREGWKGISANVFLTQTLRRCRKREVAAIGITEKKLVPSAECNFLFVYAYMGLPAAAASIHPLALDSPWEQLLVERFAKIALHEPGYTFGLDHHDYEEQIDCLMVGDVSVYCTETVDFGGIRFCHRCLRIIRGKIRRLTSDK